MESGTGERQAPRLLFGVVVLGLGVALLLDRVEVWDMGGIGRLWPLFVIVPGVLSLLSQGVHGGGLVFVTVGSLFLLRNYGGPALRDTWPAIVIAAGLSLTLSAALGGPRCDGRRSLRES